jgi:hypothetical protein
LARLFPRVLLAPTANRVISAGEHEKAETRARDRTGSSNAAAAAKQTRETQGNGGGCGRRDEERGREKSL